MRPMSTQITTCVHGSTISWPEGVGAGAGRLRRLVDYQTGKSRPAEIPCPAAYEISFKYVLPQRIPPSPLRGSAPEKAGRAASGDLNATLLTCTR